MYYSIIQQCIHSLRNLDGMLDKAIKYGEMKKFDPNVFAAQRLAPDMFPLARQVQIACDAAKNAASLLVDRSPPKHEDTETTLVELRARVAKCIAYLEIFKEDDFKRLEPHTKIRLTHPPGKAMHASDFILSRSLPNFFFHLSAAYMILRHNGVDLGKSDYLGQQRVIDA